MKALRFFIRLCSPASRPEFVETLREFRHVSLQTILPVILVSLLIGATATLMGFHAFTSMGTQAMVGSYSALVCMRELAPLLTGAMIAAKPGTAMTAYLATMRSSEQIDALEAMGVDPFRQLLVPRVGAFILAAPALVVFADAAALVSSYFTAIYQLDVGPGAFLADLTRFVSGRDLLVGLVKGTVFAALCATIAAYHGFHGSTGPRGVSRAITRAMVTMTLAVVVANLVLSEVFY